MSFYASMKATHIKASTEEKLELKLRELEIEHDGMIKIINVYRGSSGVVCWYYHDFKKAGIPKKQPEGTVTKKKAKKKVSKKVVKKAGN